MLFFLALIGVVAGVQTLLAMPVLAVLHMLNRKVDRLMDGEATLQSDLDVIADDLSLIETAVSAAITTAGKQAALIAAQQEQIVALQAQLAAGTPVTPTQLDDLIARAEAAKAAANAIVATLTPAAAPPVEPVETPAPPTETASGPTDAPVATTPTDGPSSEPVL